jgi:hypothetical protein
VFTARYALSPYIKQTRFFFKWLTNTFVIGGFVHFVGCISKVITEQFFLKLFFVFILAPFYLLAEGVEGLLLHLITLNDTPLSVGLLWTRNRPVTQRPLPHNTKLATDRDPCSPVEFEHTTPESQRP